MRTAISPRLAIRIFLKHAANGKSKRKGKSEHLTFAFQAFGLFFHDQWSCTAEWFLTESL